MDSAKTELFNASPIVIAQCLASLHTDFGVNFQGRFFYMNKSINRGDLYYADLNPVVGSEQGGIRPVLVI